MGGMGGMGGGMGGMGGRRKGTGMGGMGGFPMGGMFMDEDTMGGKSSYHKTIYMSMKECRVLILVLNRNALRNGRPVWGPKSASEACSHCT